MVIIWVLYGYYMVIIWLLYGSWWLIIIWLVVLSPTPLKNHGVKVSWDDDIPNWMEIHKIPWFQSPPISYSHLYFPSAHEHVPSPIFESSTKIGAFSSKLHRVGYGPQKELVTWVFFSHNPLWIIALSHTPVNLCIYIYVYLSYTYGCIWTKMEHALIRGHLRCQLS